MLQHNCSGCEGSMEIDCSVCKLSELRERAKKADARKRQQKRNALTVEEDDYSISEQFTKKDSDNSILYLAIAAFAVFILVVLFMKLFHG